MRTEAEVSWLDDCVSELVILVMKVVSFLKVVWITVLLSFNGVVYCMGLEK